MTRRPTPTPVAGDRLVVHAHHLGEPARDAEILEVRGARGPYLVRWDDGRESVIYPGPDVTVEHFPTRSHTLKRPGLGR